MENEIWKTILGEPDHQASNLGRVRSLDRDVLVSANARCGPCIKRLSGALKKLSLGAGNHLRVSINNKNYYVHTLVMLAFVGPRPHGMECRHTDGNEKNNRADNLEWATHTRNIQDKKWHKGSKHEAISGKLSACGVNFIKLAIKHKSVKTKELVRLFNVSRTAIYSIRDGKIHRDVVVR